MITNNLEMTEETQNHIFTRRWEGVCITANIREFKKRRRERTPPQIKKYD